MIAQEIEELIERALSEDIGDGDHSTISCIPEEETGSASLLIKDDGIIAGLEVASILYERVDPDIVLTLTKYEGARVTRGDIGFIVEGRIRSLLTAERVVLNFLQRMSGIATETRRYVDELSGLKTQLLDTRKTTPGMRLIEKEAVRIGGGINHRMGLYDMIMLKDNHIDAAGGITNAIDSANNYLSDRNLSLDIEIETRTIEDVREVIERGGVSRIMLDNFSVEDTRQAVALIAGRFEIESSGGITFKNLRSYAECGVDYISVGALTHHISSLDMSLKIND